MDHDSDPPEAFVLNGRATPDDLAGDELLRAALGAMRDVAIIVFDADMVIRAVHGGAVGERGYDVDALIDRRAPDVLPAPIWELVGPLYVRTLAGESSTQDVHSHDGTAIYETRCEPVRRGGRVVGGVAISRDVTEHRRAAAALAVAERRLADELRPLHAQRPADAGDAPRLLVYWEHASVEVSHGGRWVRVSAPFAGRLAREHRLAAAARLREDLARIVDHVDAIIIRTDTAGQLHVELTGAPGALPQLARSGDLASRAGAALRHTA